ncbi:MAG: hypothetical protein ACLQU1_01395 [Bryobacteraceae bacterium]
MSAKTTIAGAMAAGFLGGIVSQRIAPAPVRAQEQTRVPQEIRARKFVLVDEAGVDRGVFGFAVNKKGQASPTIELMGPQGHTYGYSAYYPMTAGKAGLLPDATCPTCSRKPAKQDSAASPGDKASK